MTGRSVSRRDRPLLDPKRRPFVRAALNAKQFRAERDALAETCADPERHARAVDRLKDLMRQLEDGPE